MTRPVPFSLHLLYSQERIEQLIPLFFLFIVLNIKLSKYASPIRG